MNIESWVEPPYQPIYQFGDPAEMIIPLEAGFTHRQRQWYLRAFDNQCWFPTSVYDGKLVPCGVSDKLEVHHITPASMTIAQEPWQDPNETLGIPLCQFHHQRIVHPDVGMARDLYQYDTNSFKKAIAKHVEAAERSEVFWCDEYDEALRAIATSVILRYTQENPTDIYPKDVSWLKRSHPKKSHWTDVF